MARDGFELHAAPMGDTANSIQFATAKRQSRNGHPVLTKGPTLPMPAKFRFRLRFATGRMPSEARHSPVSPN